MHGFDTFSGIPHDWHSVKSGAYSTHGALPEVPGNVQLHKGLFSESLPPFLATRPPTEPVRYASIDMDLYQYSIAVERVRIPRNLRRTTHAGNFFPFDQH